MSTAPHLALGRAAEAAAARHLERLGYRLITTNFRARGGELDLVALDGDSLAIIEVRYRATDRYGGAAASITPASDHASSGLRASCSQPVRNLPTCRHDSTSSKSAAQSTIFAAT